MNSIQLQSIGFDKDGIEVFAAVQDMPRPSANKPSQQPYGLMTWLVTLALLAISIIARGHFLYGA
jgi:hypothetical protein